MNQLDWHLFSVGGTFLMGTPMCTRLRVPNLFIDINSKDHSQLVNFKFGEAYNLSFHFH